MADGERLGLLGGTFDPPHVGHLVAAAETRWALGLDRVLLVVANDPWQKSGVRAVSPAADRLALVEALVGGVPGIQASDLEIVRGGPTYTIDTIAALRAADPGCELFVILGRDAAAGLPSWERAEELRGAAAFVVVDRGDRADAGLPEGWAFTEVTIPRLDISSTELRRRIAEGRPVTGLVPVAVESAIRDRGLYRGRRP